MLSDVELRGGRAHFNGVSFYSDQYHSMAVRSKKWIISRLEKRSSAEKVFRLIDRVPLLRGVWLPIELPQDQVLEHLALTIGLDGFPF